MGWEEEGGRENNAKGVQKSRLKGRKKKEARIVEGDTEESLAAVRGGCPRGRCCQIQAPTICAQRKWGVK